MLKSKKYITHVNCQNHKKPVRCILNSYILHQTRLVINMLIFNRTPQVVIQTRRVDPRKDTIPAQIRGLGPTLVADLDPIHQEMGRRVRKRHPTMSQVPK